MQIQKLSQTRRMAQARLIKKKMQGNPLFPSPPVLLSDLQVQINKTQIAYIASRDSGKTERAVFRNELYTLEKMMIALGKYVEVIANKNHSKGDEIISGAGMHFRKHTKAQVQNFSIKNAKMNGTLHASMKAQGKEVIYLWECREKGAGAWIRKAETLQAKYSYENLKSGTAYEFRGGYVLRNGEKKFFSTVKLTVL